MALELEHHCPECEDAVPFYLAASTCLHLGEKTKWKCPECGYAFVRIDGDIDSSKTSA